MDKSTIEKLAKRLAALHPPKDETSKIFYKPSEEGDVVRIVPYPHQETPFIELYYHYDIGKEKSILCPKEMYGKPCPICDFAEEFKALGGSANWKLYNKFKAKIRVYVPVIVRGKEEDGIKLWGFGPQMYEELIGYVIDPEWGDLSDPKVGHDISLRMIPKGKPGNDTSYPKTIMKLKPSVSKLGITLPEIPNFLENGLFVIKPYEDLMVILQNMQSGVDPDLEFPPKDDSDDTTNSDDIESKLNDLLK